MKQDNRRRWTSRCHKSCDVAIRCRGRDGVETLIRGITHNLGFGGMFVTTDQSNDLFPVYSEVDVMLLNDQFIDKQRGFFRANVTRVTKDGVGLRFIYDDADSCRTLQAVLI